MRSQISMDWDCAKRCAHPVLVEYKGAKKYGRGIRGPLHVISISAPCRKCPGCLRARSWKWINRAIVETEGAARTWMVTLTFRPSEHAKNRMRAISRYGAAAWNDIPPEWRQGREFSEAAKEVTKWMKRLRFNTSADLRYFLVAEAHKSGLPHFHALVHERIAGAIGARDITGAWVAGFSRAKLADANSAEYVGKYLSKSMLARVRASERYGLGHRARRRSRAPVLNPPPQKPPKVFD